MKKALLLLTLGIFLFGNINMALARSSYRSSGFKSSSFKAKSFKTTPIKVKTVTPKTKSFTTKPVKQNTVKKTTKTNIKPKTKVTPKKVKTPKVKTKTYNASAGRTFISNSNGGFFNSWLGYYIMFGWLSNQDKDDKEDK